MRGEEGWGGTGMAAGIALASPKLCEVERWKWQSLAGAVGACVANSLAGAVGACVANSLAGAVDVCVTNNFFW